MRKEELGRLFCSRHFDSPHGDLALPNVLGLLRNEVGDLGGHVAGGDAVCAGELDPLDSERAACDRVLVSPYSWQSLVLTGRNEVRTKVDDSGLRGIVRRLQLRDVDDVAAHGGGGDEAAVLEVRDVAFLLLLPPDLTRSAGAEEGAVQIGGDDLVVVGDLAADGGALSPRHARVGNENVEPVVELGDDLIDDLFDVCFVSDVHLVGLACG